MINKAFTLIEMIVVVAVIAMLSSFALALLGESKARTRDSRRESDMKQYQDALQIYVTDSQKYPECPVGTVSVDTANPDNNIYTRLEGNDCLLNALLTDGLLGTGPLDPLGGGGSAGDCDNPNGQVYCYVSDGFTYILKYSLETDNILGKSSGWNYVIVKH